jgi:hypothetical protein
LAKEASHLQQETGADNGKEDNEKVRNNMPTEFDAFNPAKEEIPIGPVEKPKT